MKNALIFLFLISTIHARQFTPQPFVTIEGNNHTISISQSYASQSPQYICWENQSGSIYRIMMRQIDVENGQIVTVDSSLNPLQQPNIEVSGDRIDIAWMEIRNDKGIIHYRSYQKDQITTDRIISDTTKNCSYPALGKEHIAWIQDSLLIVKSLSDSLFTLTRLDKGCSALSFDFYDYSDRFNLYYRKQNTSGSYIINLGYNKSQHDSVSVDTLSTTLVNDSPHSAAETGLSFREQDNGKWSVVAGDYFFRTYSLDSLTIVHPFYYQSTIVTVAGQTISTVQNSYEMLTFDITHNRQTDVYFWALETSESATDTINISHSTGIDEKPVMTVMPSIDTTYGYNVALFWEHTDSSGKTDIWWARDEWIISAIDKAKAPHPAHATLDPNYPNPFNPSTVIRYYLPQKGRIELTIYDQAGRKVRRLVNNIQSAGRHSVIFNAQGLASGVYFSRLSVNGIPVQTRKLMLLR